MWEFPWWGSTCGDGYLGLIRVFIWLRHYELRSNEELCKLLAPAIHEFSGVGDTYYY
jgi:hypothetical protein